jgi:hypothetical protein
MNSKYSLGICELYFKKIHGPWQQSSYGDATTNYLLYCTITADEFSTNEYLNDITLIKNNYCTHLNNRILSSEQNPNIRNLFNIISRPNYIKLDIIEERYLDGGECVAIIKTCWLKILQKNWRKKYKKRQELVMFYKNPKNLFRRELLGTRS